MKYMILDQQAVTHLMRIPRSKSLIENDTGTTAYCHGYREEIIIFFQCVATYDCC